MGRRGRANGRPSAQRLQRGARSCLVLLERDLRGVGGWSPSSQGIPAFALAEGWDGVSWRLEPAADPSGAQLTTLRAVNCPARCVAVGSYYNGSITQTLVERSH